MKKRIFLILFLFLSGCLLGSKLEFQSPNFKEPFYRINFRCEIKKDNTVIKEIQLNGGKWDNFLVFKQGKRIDLSKPLEKGTYDFFFDYAWRSKEKYKIALFYLQENSQEIKELEIKGTSPKKGGIPAGKEGFYRVFRAEESIGLERKGEVSCITITTPKMELENENLLIFEGNSPIEYQVMGIMEVKPPKKSAKNHPVTWTYNLAFLLDMASFEKKVFLVLKGESGSPVGSEFFITGTGLGKTVKNKRVSLEFHSGSGQINIIEYLREGIKLHNKEAGVIHWNPGCYIPGIAWDHSFNWNPPPSFEEKAGKFLYINSRKGPLQKIKDVVLEVRYTLDIASPYFISETRMSIKKDLGVLAIRNDEMVLHKDLFDSLIYRDKKNSTIQMPLTEKEGYPDGFVHAAADDLSWVGLLNSKQNYGFFSLRIKYANSNLSTSGNWLHKPGTYFYAPSDGKYVYWVRPLLYTWSNYTTRNLLTYVPEGSYFYEKNAYVLLPLTDDFPDKLDILLKKLKNPVRIY